MSDPRLLLMAEKLWQAADMMNDGPDESDAAWAYARLSEAVELAREFRRSEPPAGWFLKAGHVNDFVAKSLNDLIRRAKWCSICDVDLRENGQNKRFEADWLKYMEPLGKQP